jgi:hypothetical protein
MARDAAPAQPPATDREPTWWDRHRDLVVYPAVGLFLVGLGLVWNGALSLILTPIWMLVGVWLIPSAIERRVRGRR